MGGFGRVVLVLFVAACGHPATKGPAWPEAAKSDKDGGESLAPHESKQTTVAVEKADEAPAKKVDAAAPAVVPVTEGGAPAAATPAAGTTIEDAITTEEIIIEIDD